MAPKLCLGTASFGLSYGITNLDGKIPEHDVKNILSFAESAGIVFLDCAQGYGDAESVLGRAMGRGRSFKLISKLKPQENKPYDIDNVPLWEQSFFESCNKLGVDSLDTFLVHTSSDLNNSGASYLKDWLYSLRERGLVRRLGVSIYSAKDLAGLDLGLIDIVQLPLSIYDQRLIEDGTIDYLRSKSISIHARSIFLQGLLLSSASQWPSWVSKDVINHHKKLEELANTCASSLMDMCLMFIKEQADIEAIVFGVCSLLQLTQIVSTWETVFSRYEVDWHNWSIQDANLLDPRCWPGQ